MILTKKPEFDLKTGIILLLLVILILMAPSVLFKNNSDLKRDNARLEKEIKVIQKKKDSLDMSMKVLKSKEQRLKVKDSLSVKYIQLAENNTNKVKKELGKAKDELSRYRASNPASPSDTLCDNVIKEYDNLVESKDNEIAARDTLIDVKDDRITNLETQVANRELAYVMSNQQLLVKDDIISNKNRQIRRLKTTNILVGTTSGAIVAALILGIIFIK